MRLANGRLTVHWDANGETGTVFDIYRNGRLVARQVSGSSWLDPDSSNPDSGEPASTALCYAVAQRYVGSYPVSNVSHHSEPVCYGEVETILVNDPRVSVNDGTRPIIDHARSSYSDWGHEHQTMDIALTPAQSGIYLVQLLYGNAFNWVGQGITNCAKLVEVFDARDQLVTKRVVMMPQRASWDDWGKYGQRYSLMRAHNSARFVDGYVEDAELENVDECIGTSFLADQRGRPVSEPRLPKDLCVFEVTQTAQGVGVAGWDRHGRLVIELREGRRTTRHSPTLPPGCRFQTDYSFSFSFLESGQAALGGPTRCANRPEPEVLSFSCGHLAGFGAKVCAEPRR